MIQLPAVFSSHMVLQRQKNISVWGDSDAESLKITLADKSVSVVPEQGRFQAILPPFEAKWTIYTDGAVSDRTSGI